MMQGYRDMTYDGVNNALIFINENVPDKLYRNLFLTVLCNSLIEPDCQLVDSIFNNYAQIVDDIACQNFIKRRIVNKMAEPSKVKTIDDLVNKKFIGKVFKEIKDKCKDKVIYFDIWGTWCGGCINALPHTNNLHNELKNKDIEFVYICLMSKEDDWKRIIKKHKLKGIHYLFEKDQYEKLGDLLNTYGIPRYIIIDKNGGILDDNAKPPYSRALKNELLGLIE
jgi:thiol-disulfide isomerase/thioredoxin